MQDQRGQEVGGILSSVYAPGGRQLPRAKFLRSTLAFLRAQRTPFYASGVQEIRMTGGGTALRVILSAPTPLGLLSEAVGTPPGG